MAEKPLCIDKRTFKKSGDSFKVLGENMGSDDPEVEMQIDKKRWEIVKRKNNGNHIALTVKEGNGAVAPSAAEGTGDLTLTLTFTWPDGFTTKISVTPVYVVP